MAHRWELRTVDTTGSAVRQLGDTLHNLRIRAGLTQQQLAALTGGRWSRSHIGRVENGDVIPSPDFVEAMDRLLEGDHTLVQRLPSLLLETARRRSRRQRQRRDPASPSPASPSSLSPPGPRSSLARPPGSPGSPGSGAIDFQRPEAVEIQTEPKDQELRTTANRSQFLRMALWTGLGAVVESVRLTLRVEGPAGGPVTHEQLELAVTQYARSYWTTPSSVLFEQVRQCRQLVDGMLDQRQPVSRRRHLHLVAGWLSALLGNLSFHLGDYSSARMHLGTAGRLGQAAGHNGLVAWVRGAQSMVDLYDHRPEEALRMAREGQALAPNPLVRAQLASWGEARALARMGDRRGVLEAIARGSRAIASSGDDWSPGGVFSFSVGEFEQYCGTACLWLDLPEEAKRHAKHAFELRDTLAAKALARLDVAAASNQLGQPAEASQIGAEVLQMPSDYLIDPIVRRATELATSLEPHSSLAEVRDFTERLASLVPPPGEPGAARSAAER